jgi:hypothetical protein
MKNIQSQSQNQGGDASIIAIFEPRELLPCNSAELTRAISPVPQARHIGKRTADTIRQNESENAKPETNNTNPHPHFAPSGASPRLSATKGHARYQSRQRLSRCSSIAATAQHSHQQLIVRLDFESRQASAWILNPDKRQS